MAGITSAHNLANFQLSDMLELGQQIRRLGIDCDSMEEAAAKVVSYFYDHLADCDGHRCCALVRCFKTHAYAALSAELQAAASSVLPEPGILTPQTQCLVLLATIGDQPEWNDRRRSRGHLAIPLPSVELVNQMPMVAQLLRQMGLDLAHVVQPDPGFTLDLEERAFHVFHVQQAEGSPYLPAQEDFVLRYSIRSVLGFGGLLPSGELFAVILFSKVPIAGDTAEMFSTLALGVKTALIPFLGPRTFAVTRAS